MKYLQREIPKIDPETIDFGNVKRHRSPFTKKVLERTCWTILFFVTLWIFFGFVLVTQSHGKEARKVPSALDLVLTSVMIDIRNLVSSRYHDQGIVTECGNRAKCVEVLPEIEKKLGLGTEITIKAERDEQGTFFTILITNPMATHPLGTKLNIWKIQQCPERPPI